MNTWLDWYIRWRIQASEARLELERQMHVGATNPLMAFVNKLEISAPSGRPIRRNSRSWWAIRNWQPTWQSAAPACRCFSGFCNAGNEEAAGSARTPLGHCSYTGYRIHSFRRGWRTGLVPRRWRSSLWWRRGVGGRGPRRAASSGAPPIRATIRRLHQVPHRSSRAKTYGEIGLIRKRPPNLAA
jgi:hypothetical protein